MKFPLSFLLIVLLFFCDVNAQNSLNKKIDSLLQLTKLQKEENQLKLSRYEDLYKSYISLNNTQKAEYYANLTISLSEKLKLYNVTGDTYFRLGFHHHNYSRYFVAEEYYFKALEKFSKLKDNDLMGGVYQNLSAMYVNIPDYAKALDANFKAIALFTDNNDQVSVAGCYVNIASVYDLLNQQSKAVQYLEKAIPIFRKHPGNEYGTALSYANLGTTYFKSNSEELKKIGLTEGQQYQKSLDALEQSLKFGEKLKEETLLGSIFLTKANVYSALKKNDDALKFYLKSIENYAKTSTNKERAESMMALANFYARTNQNSKAETLLTDVLEIANTNKILGLQRDAYLALSNLAEIQDKPNDALKYYKKYIAFKDEIFNQEKEKEITRKQLQLDFSIKERDYQTKQKFTSLELDKQVLLVKKRQQELLLKQQQLALSDQEKNIQRLSFLQKQASLEHEKQLKENQLKQQQFVSKLQKKRTDQQLLVQQNTIKLNQNISIFLLALAIVLLTASLLVYGAKRKTAKLNKLVSTQKEELQHLNKVKDQLFSVVSHDMRAPVNSLISFIHLLENGNVSEEKLKRYAANLKNALGYTSTMMENLLNWASSQLQGVKPALEQIMVGDALLNVIATMKSEADQKQIKLFYTEKDLVKTTTDPNMLALIVRNLLSNAIKFTPKGGEISVNTNSNEDCAIIEVTDNGVGMNHDQITAFNKAENQLGESSLGTNKEKGTGLGLTLCKTFARLLNAELSAGTNSPNGTTFILKLPKHA